MKELDQDRKMRKLRRDVDYLLSTKPYKVYTALLTQSGTSDPTATVLENTLGGTVVWTRAGDGQYEATLTGAFPSSKTFLSAVYMSNCDIVWGMSRVSDNVINFYPGAGSDGCLQNTSIEVRVYY